MGDKDKGKGRVVIIGGIAAGTAAAAKCRRQDEDLGIIIYEKDKYISYGSCGLPYFVSGKIENINRQEVDFVDIPGMRKKINNGDDMTILDVRTPREYSAGHIGGAILIPVDDIRENITRLDPDKETVIYCRYGYRAYLALKVLRNHGFSDVKLLNGSYLSWDRKL